MLNTWKPFSYGAFATVCGSVTATHTLPLLLATLRCRIIAWTRQGTFFRDYYDTLMGTCNTRKDKFWCIRTIPLVV